MSLKSTELADRLGQAGSRAARRLPDKIARELQAERRLRARLLAAPSHERGALYAEAYEEVLRRMAEDPAARAAQDTKDEARARRSARALRRFVGPETRVVELGPGDGRLARRLATMAGAVTAVDVRDALARRADLPNNLQVVVTDGVSVPLPAGSVDFAYADQLIEHLRGDDALAIHRDLFAALVPGGAFLCYSPNRITGPHDLTRYTDGDAPQGLHLQEYSLRELAGLLSSCGFERCRPLIGGRSLWLPAPMWLATGLERAVEALPGVMRRRLARAPGLRRVFRILLGVRLVAYKPG